MLPQGGYHMPKTLTLATSRLDTRPFKHPSDRLHPPSTSNTRCNCTSNVPRIIDHIARTDNVPTRLATEPKASPPTRARDSAAAPPQPKDVQWCAHWWSVPEEVRSDAQACTTHMHRVLYPYAIAVSDYWHKSLGGRPLCVLDNNEQVIFRIHPETDRGGSEMQPSDAVIKMTSSGPKPYDTQHRTTLSNMHTADELCSAAVRATLLHSKPLEEWSLSTFRALLVSHESKLRISMEKWADSHVEEHQRIALRLMGIEPVEVDDRKESTHASKEHLLPNVRLERTMLSAAQYPVAQSSSAIDLRTTRRDTTG